MAFNHNVNVLNIYTTVLHDLLSFSAILVAKSDQACNGGPTAAVHGAELL